MCSPGKSMSPISVSSRPRASARVEGPAVLRVGRISLYQLDRLTPVRGQVLPRRVLALDQPHLLFTTPSLQLLFSSDSVLDPGMLFVVNQPMDLVVAGKAANVAAAMLENSCSEVVRHADVQYSRLAGENVNVIAVLHQLMLG